MEVSDVLVWIKHDGRNYKAIMTMTGEISKIIMPVVQVISGNSPAIFRELYQVNFQETLLDLSS